MKTFKNLFEELAPSEGGARLRAGPSRGEKARRGKRGKNYVRRFEYDVEMELARLREELLSGAWRPGMYRSF